MEPDQDAVAMAWAEGDIDDSPRQLSIAVRLWGLLRSGWRLARPRDGDPHGPAPRGARGVAGSDLHERRLFEP